MVDVLTSGDALPQMRLPVLFPEPHSKTPDGTALESLTVTKATAAANSCQSLTRDAIQAVRNAVNNCLTQARENEAINGPADQASRYPDASTFSVAHITTARQIIDDLLMWLDSGPFFTPAGFVTNTTAAYNVYNYVREAVWQLHHGRHWTAVSCAWNSPNGSPPRDNSHAVTAIDLASDALALAEPLGSDATRCYIRAYVKN